MIVNIRKQIRRQALLAVQNVKDFEYAEVRPLPVTLKPIVRSDCSFFVKLMYWIAGGRDPMNTGYSEYGNSITLFEQGRHIALKDVLVGDVAVWGVEGESHAAIFVEPGITLLKDFNPLMVSMGGPGTPQVIRLNALTQGVKDAGESYFPVTCLRFNVINRRWHAPRVRKVLKRPLPAPQNVPTPPIGRIAQIAPDKATPA
jgi:hypothetical protein